MLFFENRLLYSMCLNDTLPEIIEANDSVIQNLQNTLDRISLEQQQNATQLTSINTGVGSVSSSVNTTLDTNKTLLKYIKDHGELWKSKYPMIQIHMDAIASKLNIINKNTKPLQFSYVTNIVNK